MLNSGAKESEAESVKLEPSTTSSLLVFPDDDFQ